VTAEKRYDGAEVLGQVSGLGKSEVMRIWNEVKANSARLDSCVGPHDFRECGNPTRLCCAKCLGMIPKTDVRWYLAGLAHGRAHPEAA
jgi:hypothetical protein